MVQVLFRDLELKKGAVDLVDNTDRFNPLTKGLSKHGLGLDTHTFDTVDYNESTVGNTESSSNFGREINVTGRINQVDQEIVSLDLLRDIL